MTYDEALAKVAAEGATRAYRLSDSTAYAYRLKNNKYEARGIYAVGGDWKLGNTLVSAQGVGRSADGWYGVIGMPRRALPIENEAAKKNPGYSTVVLRQCYTCKQFKPEAEFQRAGGDSHRNWECNECYGRRQRELAAYYKAPARAGDFLDRQTLASPPPPQGKI
jgi:hypothetical protein